MCYPSGEEKFLIELRGGVDMLPGVLPCMNKGLENMLSSSSVLRGGELKTTWLGTLGESSSSPSEVKRKNRDI